MRLYQQNPSVDSYNSYAILKETYNVTYDTLVGYKNHTEAATAQQKIHKMSVVELYGLPYKIPLAVGYPYIIKTNINVEDGIVNSRIVVLTLYLPHYDLLQIACMHSKSLSFEAAVRGPRARRRPTKSHTCSIGDICGG
ncbi:hypothetical protein TNCV_4666351 [Trichonephila clavipes]|nr:hypothetical protein TNCV_4666351 [Trichonephila clavipes]